MEEKKSVVVDMDGCIVNVDAIVRNRFTKDLNFDLAKDNRNIFNWEEVIRKYVHVTEKEANEIMLAIWNEKDFWTSLQPYEGAIETINELSKECNIIICTRIPRGCSNAFIEKENWINDHFPKNRFEFFAVSNGAKKMRIKCDYIIEDRLKEMAFHPDGVVAILIDRPWNSKESSEWSEGLEFIRVSNWKDIPKIILKK
jgi:5'(3')-deoxyribonucleotidase